MFVRIGLVGLAIAGAACGGARGPVEIAGTPGVTIPAALKRALDSTWRGWQVVTPPADVSACATRYDQPPAPVTSADFNGDGIGDFALQIATPEGRHVVAGLARIDGEYDVRAISAVDDAAGVLGIKRRGSAYRTQADGLAHFYGLDTLAFGACSQPETAYFWTGTGFEGNRVY